METEIETGVENVPNLPATMTIYELSRWGALLEAVELIAEKCADKGVNIDSPGGLKYLKPLDIQDYVNSRTDTLMMKLKTSRKIEENINSIKFMQIEKQLSQLQVVD